MKTWQQVAWTDLCAAVGVCDGAFESVDLVLGLRHLEREVGLSSSRLVVALVELHLQGLVNITHLRQLLLRLSNALKQHNWGVIAVLYKRNVCVSVIDSQLDMYCHALAWFYNCFVTPPLYYYSTTILPSALTQITLQPQHTEVIIRIL